MENFFVLIASAPASAGAYAACLHSSDRASFQPLMPVVGALQYHTIRDEETLLDIGRLVIRGCIRLYPEHIERLFDEVHAGDKVEIIYEPVKLGVEGGVLLMEVHPDIYDRVPDMHRDAEHLFFQMNFTYDIDWIAVYRCIDLQKGVPTVIGAYAKGGESVSATATPD